MRGKQLRMTDFSGGLNDVDDIVDLSLEQSPSVLDMRPVGRGGSILQRTGDAEEVDYTAVHATGSYFPLFVAKSLDRLLIPTAGEGLVERQLALVPASPTQLEATGSGTGRYTFVEAPASGGQGPIYFIRPSGGGRIARYWTGSGATATWTASTGTLPATARFLLYAGNRVWAARTDAEDSAIYWSEIGDPRNWPAANVVKLAPNDGEEITGISTVGDQIVVFKESKAFVIYDLDTGANRPLGLGYGNDKVSNVASKQVLGITAETALGVVFTTRSRGWQVTDGITIRRLADVVGTQLTITGVAHFDDSLFIAYGGSRFYEFDLRSKTWWAHTSATGVNIIGLATHVIDDVPILFASGRGARIDRLMSTGQANADSSAMAPRWTTPWIALGSERQKRIRAMEFRGKGTVTFTGTKDYTGTSLFARGPSTVADRDRLMLPTLGMARALKVEVAGSGTGASDVLRLDELVVHTDGRRD